MLETLTDEYARNWVKVNRKAWMTYLAPWQLGQDAFPESRSSRRAGDKRRRDDPVSNMTLFPFTCSTVALVFVHLRLSETGSSDGMKAAVKGSLQKLLLHGLPKGKTTFKVVPGKVIAEGNCWPDSMDGGGSKLVLQGDAVDIAELLASDAALHAELRRIRP